MENDQTTGNTTKKTTFNGKTQEMDDLAEIQVCEENENSDLLSTDLR